MKNFFRKFEHNEAQWYEHRDRHSDRVTLLLNKFEKIKHFQCYISQCLFQQAPYRYNLEEVCYLLCAISSINHSAAWWFLLNMQLIGCRTCVSIITFLMFVEESEGSHSLNFYSYCFYSRFCCHDCHFYGLQGFVLRMFSKFSE